MISYVKAWFLRFQLCLLQPHPDVFLIGREPNTTFTSAAAAAAAAVAAAVAGFDPAKG